MQKVSTSQMWCGHRPSMMMTKIHTKIMMMILINCPCLPPGRAGHSAFDSGAQPHRGDPAYVTSEGTHATYLSHTFHVEVTEARSPLGQ